MAGAALTTWLKRDHLVVLLALSGLILLAWLDLLRRAGVLAPVRLGQEIAMPQMAPWGAGDFLVTAVMWTVMMAAMMLPSVAPMVLLFATVTRRKVARGNPAVPTLTFLLGYLLVWTGFSLAATGAQGGLHALLLLTPELALTSAALGGLVLIAAGLYQFTRLKETCLAHCQSPLDFLLLHWRRGTGGALAMGLHHGAYCLGCCWALMLLLFAGGIMNLTWIALLAGVVLLEKVAAKGILFRRLTGALLLLWGLALTWQALPI